MTSSVSHADDNFLDELQTNSPNNSSVRSGVEYSHEYSRDRTVRISPRTLVFSIQTLRKECRRRTRSRTGSRTALRLLDILGVDDSSSTILHVALLLAEEVESKGITDQSVRSYVASDIGPEPISYEAEKVSRYREV